MRHNHKRTLEINSGVQKKQQLIRNLITSLITHGQIITTTKRAKVLKSEIDQLFAKLLGLYTTQAPSVARREAIRLVKSIVFTDHAGKKVIDELVPKYQESAKTGGFVIDVKLGPRA
jgi:ribosomal protein L17